MRVRLFIIIAHVTIITESAHCGLMLFCKVTRQFLYNKQNNTRTLGNMKFISRVFTFPRIHVLLFSLLYKMECFIDFSATNKSDNLTCDDYR